MAGCSRDGNVLCLTQQAKYFLTRRTIFIFPSRSISQISLGNLSYLFPGKSFKIFNLEICQPSCCYVPSVSVIRYLSQLQLKKKPKLMVQKFLTSVINQLNAQILVL